MQVSPPAAPSSTELAGSLLALWKFVAREAGGQFADLLEDLDLSLAQLKTLETLTAHPAAPSVKELSESLGCSLANSSRAVDALVRRGLLERREDEADRRVKRLTITAAGVDAIARIDALRLRGLEQYAATLTDDQRERLAGALTGLPAA
ncbi:MAG TPA: MarR family transcriptional regulator [Solirubrobacteraceae bacterium]|nr:MarR family transcriptional regulator [Solirubrobacteraceae bacterium]